MCVNRINKNAERIVHIHDDGSDAGKACLSVNQNRTCIHYYFLK